MALSLIRFTPFRLFLILLTLQNHIPKVVDTTRKNAMAQLENHGGKGFPKRVGIPRPLFPDHYSLCYLSRLIPLPQTKHRTHK